jgi:hypothetical protein
MFSARLLVLALVAMGLGAQAAPGNPAKTAPEPSGSSTAVQAEIPQSVFIIPVTAKEGRNPFFPHSIAEAPVATPRATVLDTSGVVLNGVTSRPTPMVMINGVTFVKGEEHEIRLPSGARVKVRCDEIREDSALVLVNGVLARELRMRAGL